MNRGDFQQLAEEHLRHAKALLDAGLYSGAYYMCGYVVECALKACSSRRTNQFDFYPNPNDSRDAWSHNFEKLVKFDTARQADKELDVKWKSVEINWSPDSRYETHDQEEAQELFDAISDRDHGVFSCIKQHW